MEYKFRCWDEDHFVYSTDEPSNPPKDGDSWFGFEDGVLKAWVSTTEGPGDAYDPPYPSSEELEGPIEMWTGLKDKKGVEIYEGDIYTSYGLKGYYVVEFSVGSFVAGPVNQPVRVPLGWEGQKKDTHYIETEVEIIGSIHDNPELLTPDLTSDK